MRLDLERGSGTATTLIVIGGITALAFGLLSGISAVRHATDALRTAEREAIGAATAFSEGEPDPCARVHETVVDCVRDGRAVTVTVVRNGIRASATAGPDR